MARLYIIYYLNGPHISYVLREYYCFSLVSCTLFLKELSTLLISQKVELIISLYWLFLDYINAYILQIKMSRWRDSNPRPADYKSAALAN